MKQKTIIFIAIFISVVLLISLLSSPFMCGLEGFVEGATPGAKSTATTSIACKGCDPSWKIKCAKKDRDIAIGAIGKTQLSPAEIAVLQDKNKLACRQLYDNKCNDKCK